MNYGQVRDKALHLIHQESIAGTVIPGTYNNQQDYLNKIPGLVDDAQMDLATTAKKIPVSKMLSELTCTQQGNFNIYTLPEDMWQLRGSGLLVLEPDRFRDRASFRRFGQLRYVERNKIIVPGFIHDTALVEYYRYPEPLPDPVTDETELDNVPETHAAIPYYVAAHLCLLDDAFVYATLYNEYEEKKAQMMELPVAEPNSVEDVLFEGSLYNFWG